MIDDIDLFDAQFFNYSPAEAALTDPQHRLFIEVAWETLEKAGYASEKYNGTIGVYAGSGMSGYIIHNIIADKNFFAQQDPYQVLIAAGSSFLATKTSYHLNLTGPSLNINTACSTSLVAIVTACAQLLSYECDVALAHCESKKPIGTL